jgi:hypothetical protein
MRSFSVLALVGSALAAPLITRQMGGSPKCMTRDEANFMVKVYEKLIAAYTPEDGEKYTTADFVDTSDSINTFIHQALGGPTFPTKQAFLDVQLSNPPFPVELISVDAIDCASIGLQWKASFGQAHLPSKGITILKTAYVDGMWKIKSIDVEFNALTWLLDMGGSYSWEGKTWTAESPDPALMAKGGPPGEVPKGPPMMEPPVKEPPPVKKPPTDKC